MIDLSGLTRPGHRGRAVAAAAVMGTACFVCALALAGCRATRPADEPESRLTIQIDVVPMIMPADTTRTATVLVTVTDADQPVADSTRVVLLATIGTVPLEVLTRDGVATTTYRPSLDTGVATIVAVVRGERDSTHITIY